jgi:hypothetical protein
MSSSSRSPSRDSIEVDRIDGYLLFLFALLSTATLFDGFDAAMLTVAAPDTRRTLGISLAPPNHLVVAYLPTAYSKEAAR